MGGTNMINEDILILMEKFFPYFWMGVFYLDMRNVIKSLEETIKELCEAISNGS